MIRTSNGVDINIYKVRFHPIMRKALVRYADHRLLKETLDFYAAPDSQAIVVAHVAVIGATTRNYQTASDVGRVIGISVAALIKQEVLHGATAVHKRFRQEGIGTALLKAKIAAFKELNIVYGAWVATDNRPSIKMCNRAGLGVAQETIKKRARGEYDAWEMRPIEEGKEVKNVNEYLGSKKSGRESATKGAGRRG